MKNNFSKFRVVVFLVMLSCGARQNKQPSKAATAIKIEYAGHIYIPCSINDSIIANLIFDTGADSFYIDSSFCAKLKSTVLNNRIMGGVGNRQRKVNIYQDSISLAFGSNSLKVFGVPIIDLKSIAGYKADGLIGIDYFKNRILKIDYQNEIIELLENNNWIDTSFQKIPFEYVNNKMAIRASCIVRKDLSIHGKFLIDLGYPGTVLLTAQTAKKYLLEKEISNKIKYSANDFGLGGNSSGFDLRVFNFSLNKFDINKLPIQFSLDSLGALSTTLYTGIIGNKLLKKFTVILDFLKQNIYLKPNSTFSERTPLSTSGMLLTDRRDRTAGLLVMGFYENSDAHKKGIRPGDIVTHINGKSVNNISFNTILKTLNQINKPVDLILKRKDSTFTVGLFLRENI